MEITLTPEAEAHLVEELEGRLLRIAFTTGCGGSGYRLAFADEPFEDDVVVKLGQVTLALDDIAAKRLTGAVVQYDSEEQGYLIDHPDAVAAVWCG